MGKEACRRSSAQSRFTTLRREEVLSIEQYRCFVRGIEDGVPPKNGKKIIRIPISKIQQSKETIASKKGIGDRIKYQLERSVRHVMENKATKTERRYLKVHLDGI